MSKNLNRKGLAFGALVAMTASLFAGAPALAATDASLNTATYTGTGTTVIEGTDFTFTTSKSTAFDYVAVESAFAGTFRTADIERYNVITCEAIAVDEDDYCTAWAQSGTVERADGLDRDGNGTTEDERENHVIYQNGTSSDVLLASEEAQVGDFYYVDADGIDNYVATSALHWDISETTVERIGSGSASAVFAVKSAGITADTTVTLTPYVTVTGDLTPTLAEAVVSGTAKTVTFLNNTGTLLTTTLTGTVVGVATQDLKVTVTGPAAVNMTQMDDDLEVLVSRSQSYLDDANLTTNSSNVAETPVWSGVTTGYYTARVYNNDGTTDTATAVGNTVAFSALTSEVIVGQLSPDSKITGISFDDVATANITEDRYVRAGTKSFDIAAQLYTTDGADDGSSDDKYAKSGVSVKYTASLDGDQAVGSEIKINGTVITSAGVTVTVPTDANGIAKVTITSKDGANADEINVMAEVLNASGIITANCVDTWYWETVDYDNIWETKDIGWNEDDENVIGTTRNGVVTLNYEVTDQFAVPFVKAGYEYQIRVFEEDEGDDTLLGSAALENGKATVTFTNQALPGQSYTVYGELFERAINVLNPTWSATEFYYTSEIWVNHNSTIGGVSASNEGEGNGQITFEDFFDYNFNLGGSNNTSFSSSDHLNEDSMDRIMGVVVDANNVPVAGAAVTIASSGVQFSDHNLVKTGSITVYTNEYGEYGVEWYSHKAGDNLFTVTSGGKTATVTVTLDNPTALHASDVLTVNAPAAVQAGTVTPVKVTLKDKYGNGIDGAAIALGLVGEGYLSTPSATTDAGTATVLIINGVNDTSVAYISAATAHAAVDPSWNRVNKTFTQKVTTGSVATVKGGAVKGRLLVDVDNSRGETVRVFVNGKLVKKMVANSNNALIKINGLPKGKHKVTVTSDYQNLVTKAPVTIK